jgi:acyl-coenzyme A synthetase/AMP-(fatty) acid ligase
MSNGMPKALPLVSHIAPDSIVAWCTSEPITLQQFLHDVSQLIAQLLPGRHILNVCSDRYHFSVGLAAAMTTGRVSLLPATHTPEMASQLKAYAADVFCLTDSETCSLALPQLQYPAQSIPPNITITDCALQVPTINDDQLVATVFTSGSTGTPLPHNKTWGSLVQCVKAEARRVGLSDIAAPTALIATVPPQHMYGFESSILMAWQTGHIISSAHPFYPADVCQALAEAPSPRILISTPVHLQALIDTALPIPETKSILSATAPLSSDLAESIEAHFHAPLIEIYGSTETGQIATRQPSKTSEWKLFDDISLKEIDGHVFAEGGHISSPTLMNDKIELMSATSFLLHGRLTDMINIAGKRHSLASLNHQLTRIEGVIDGTFFMPNEDQNKHVTRLVAFVVCKPEVDSKHILATLRKHLDPVFIPRPLFLVDKLPRNSTGKLPMPLLQALFDAKTKVRKSA